MVVVVSRDGRHDRRPPGDGARGSRRCPTPRELDMLLTAGERIAMSLLGIAINARGCRAASYTGSQAGIITDTQHGAAQDRRDPAEADPRGARGGQRRDHRRVPGPVDRDYEITTLGRGGSDTTAVAMAGGAGRRGLRDLHRRRGRVHRRPADRSTGAQGRRASPTRRCSSSPRRARRSCSSRSVEYARRHGVKHPRPVVVRRRARHVGAGGRRGQMEGVLISGVALDADEAKVTLERRARPARRRRHGVQGDRWPRASTST